MSARRAVSVGLIGLVVALVAAPAVHGAVPVGDADFSGYSTGAVNHIHALQTGTTRLVDTEVAFSGASVASKGLDSQLVNEVNTVVQPAQSGKNSFGRGSGVEIGVATGVPVSQNQVLLPQIVTANAPPDSANSQEVLNPVVDPLVSASTLRAEARARWGAPGVCVLGSDLSLGRGYAEDARLVDTAPDPATDFLDSPLVASNIAGRNVSESKSTLRLVAQQDANGNVIGSDFGLMAETRQTIAPVTLLGNTATPITIEFAGQWVLRAVATGLPGGAFVHYGPGDVSPTTPVLTITGVGSPIEITLQDLLGPTGLTPPPIVIPGVGELEIAIGEDPRAIGGDASTSPTTGGDGTEASAAVDVVRVRLSLALGTEVIDLRVGHMETKAKVPAGGISCPIPVEKTADPPSVSVGGNFTTNIRIINPFDCELRNVSATDEITTTSNARYSVESISDGGTYSGTDRAGTVTWSNLGSIPPGGSKTISVTFRATRGSGVIHDKVTVRAVCGIGSVDGVTTVDVSLQGQVELDVPVGPGAVLPVTGGPTYAYLTGMVLVGAAGVWLGSMAWRLRPRSERG